MNKAERKRRAAELKRKAKEAKRAKRTAENQPARLESVAAPNDKLSSDGGEVASGAVGEAPTAGAGEGACATDTGEGARATAVGRMPTAGADIAGNAAHCPGNIASGDSTPQHSLDDEVHMSYSKLHKAEAEMVEADIAEMLGDDEAIAMLTRAARSLDNVIQYVESVLKRLPAEQVAEAIAIKGEPRRDGEKSRNGSNRAVQLLNIRLRAKNLLLRVMKILKPDLAKQLAKA